MQPPAFSLIIVSRHRPDWLRRCLKAVGQLDYPRFESIVVACPEGEEVAKAVPGTRVIGFDAANISAARNAGADAAWGDIIAFLDDDSVPEPTWLAHLALAFADPEVVQAGGITLGRNGISVQHGAALVDDTGHSHPLHMAPSEPVVIHPKDHCHPRLHGTNMALRRAALLEHGGFDTRFAFYLDETDLSYRISRAGGKTVFQPKAVVHHASGASRFRQADRTPRDVLEIAASAAVFHLTHSPTSKRNAAQDAFLSERRNWILRHMQTGGLPPDRAWALIRDLDAGYAAGRSRVTRQPAQWSVLERGDIVPTTTTARAGDLCLVTSGGNAKDIHSKAKDLVAQGNRVTVLDYQRTARFHHVRFTQDGVWLHTGGIYGKEMRTEPMFRKSSKEERWRQTLDRLAGIRSIDPLNFVDKT